MFARGEVESCSAMSKRNKRRCRFAPMRGSHLCYWHGGTGGDNRKPTMPTSLRHLANKSIKKAREYSDRELERRHLAGELHPELRRAFRDTDRSRLHPADESRLMLALDDSLHGRLTAVAWRDTRKALVLDPPRAAPTPPKAPEPEPEFVELWGSRGAKANTNGW
jgi:hypothetical protein